ncbi:SAV_915 family protein [Streptomyces sp. NPDC001083]|uniref:SAV_915 family protein n=1 Tax=Streptomyces sp. NPDC001083 TaxID=3364545 RepID=UPI00367CA279
MHHLSCGEDPEPAERFPAGALFVPVRPGSAGCTARLFRTPLGERTAVGFTSERRLTATLGPGHAWIRLAEPALRALAEPLGVTTVTVDPSFSAPAPTPNRAAPAPHRAAPAPDRAAPAPDRAVPALTRTGPPTPASFGAAASVGQEPAAPRARRSAWDPQAVGVLRVTGAAAVVSALALWIG